MYNLQLLIAFESGLVVVWDLRAKAAEWRGCLGTGGPQDGVRAAAWQHDGKLMTAHVDGALATWTARAPRPTSLSYPHGQRLTSIPSTCNNHTLLYQSFDLTADKQQSMFLDVSFFLT